MTVDIRITHFDPWLHASRKPRLPQRAKLVIAYEAFHNPADYLEAIFLVNAAGKRNLWMVRDATLDAIDNFLEDPAVHPVVDDDTLLGLGVFLSTEKGETTTEVLEHLLATYVGAVGRCQAFGKAQREGLFPAARWNWLVNTTEGAHRLALVAALRAEQENPSPIVRVAREYRLHPEPYSGKPSQWQARCPETQHWIYISTETNTFGCGYCKRKGGPEELRRFAEERQTWAAKRQAEYAARQGQGAEKRRK